MKRKVIIVGISIAGVILFLGLIFTTKKLFLNKNQQSFFNPVNTKERAEEKKIKENKEKYHPKVTKRTKEQGIEIKAKSAIVIDAGTNEIIYQKDPHQKLPPASICKIATMIVALENLKKDNLIEISQKAADKEPNKIVMKAGEKLKLDDLLYGLMMISANDAAQAIAEAFPGGYEGFLEKVSTKLHLLGLSDTSLKNPSGLDEEGHISTPYDIGTMAYYSLINHPEFIQYAGKKDDHAVYPTDHNESHWWAHISGMLYRYSGMIAAKTGYTEEAKSTFLGVAERNGKRIIVVFMGSDDANGDAPKLLDFGFSN